RIDRIPLCPAIKIVESAGNRRDVIPDVPLAHHCRPITGRPQHLGNRDAVRLQLATIAPLALIARHRADTRLMWIQTGEQRSSRWATACAVIKLRKSQSSARQGIEI